MEEEKLERSIRKSEIPGLTREEAVSYTHLGGYSGKTVCRYETGQLERENTGNPDTRECRCLS